jgi:hypothetical protein
MPGIIRLDGVKVYIYPQDHPPPHIHAMFSGAEALISIESGYVLRGSLPPAKLRLVVNWLAANRDWVSYMWDEINMSRPARSK